MTTIIDHLEQPDSQTCQSAAIAKVLGTTDIYKIRRELLAGGTAGDPYNMSALMGEYVSRGALKSASLSTNASLQDVKDWVTKGSGFEVIIHGWFTSVGHVVGIEGFEDERFIYDDPWYEFDFPRSTFTRNLGKNISVSALGIFAYCVAGTSKYDANRIYQKGGPTDWNLGNAWVHFVQN